MLGSRGDDGRWFPLANNLPPDLVNVREYGALILDNYLFIVGGYRITSQEISGAFPPQPQHQRVAPGGLHGQKRYFSQLLVLLLAHPPVPEAIPLQVDSTGINSSHWRLF